MHAALQRVFDRLRTSFWFVPSLMLLAAAGLAIVLLRLDTRLDPGTEAKLQWAYSGGPQGARSLLSTVAGSMITAASVTFSLASVALSLASQQYGSRVLRNFMRDTVTQVMLGTFVSTFLYCVLVVRAIRGSDYGGGFVPAVSISTGIVLTLLSLLSLVYFVHHVSTSIQASHIIEVIIADLEDAMVRLYPSQSGESEAPDGTLANLKTEGTTTVALQHSGYLQSIDLDGLLELACAAGLVIELLVMPGDFVLSGQPVARLSGGAELGKGAMGALVHSFVLGGERTPTQDIRYQYQQLTDVIVRALSPGINDPFTAINGIEQLSGVVLSLARRSRVSGHRKDARGQLRLVARVPNVSEVLDQTVGHIGIYGAADRFVMVHLRRLLSAVEPELRTRAEAESLRRLRVELGRREAEGMPA